MKHKYNTDHICAQSKTGTNDPHNKREVNMGWHSALHQVFNNRLPHERIERLLKWDSQVIQEPTFEEIMEVIEHHVRDHKFYISGVLRNIPH